MGELDDKDPDPSILTSESMFRIDKSLRELVFRENLSLKELVMIRLEEMDKAIELAHDDLVRFPTEVTKQVGNLKELHEEKFASIHTQFKERDVRVEQTARDTKVAVDAALQAAEKARTSSNESFDKSIAKSEAATTKQIDQLVTLLQTNTKSLEDKITDLKDRFNRGEGRSEGADKTVTTHQASSSLTIAIIAAVIAALFGVAGVVIAVVK